MDWINQLGALLTGTAIGTAQRILQNKEKEEDVSEAKEEGVKETHPALYTESAPQQSSTPVLNKDFVDDVKEQLRKIKEDRDNENERLRQIKIAKLKKESDANWTRLPKIIKDTINNGGGYIGNWSHYGKPVMGKNPFILLERSKYDELKSLGFGRIDFWKEGDELPKGFGYLTIDLRIG